MKWGDPSRELLDSRKEFGACIDSDRLIILNPVIRKNPLLAAETFCHEIQHAFNAEARRRRIKGWIQISHPAISRYELAWGAFLLENGVTFTKCDSRPQKQSSRRS